MLPDRSSAQPPCRVTVNLPLVGAPAEAAVTHSMNQSQGLHSYGTDAAAVAALPGAQNWLMDGLSEAMVRFAARFEYARTVEDMLARRSRLLFLDARKAAEIAPRVAAILTGGAGCASQRFPGADPPISARSGLICAAALRSVACGQQAAGPQALRKCELSALSIC